MRLLRWAAILMLLTTGCASYRVAGMVQSGRQALLTNNPEAALGYFQQAANEDPRYVFTTALFSEGVLTYLGRTQYLTGKLSEARQTLERALDYNPNDHMARLYLGLTLARTGEVDRGVREIAAGLKGLHDWIDYTATHRLTLGYWDSTYQIRSAIMKDLQMIGGKDINLETLIADAEWVGREIEEETQRVLREEQRYLRDRDYWRGGRGASIGVGIGF